MYPGNSYFGELLTSEARAFATRGRSTDPVCESAFSAGIKAMVLNGLGVAWLPMSMVYPEIESGDLVNLSGRYGSTALNIAFYVKTRDDALKHIQALWSKQ